MGTNKLLSHGNRLLTNKAPTIRLSVSHYIVLFYTVYGAFMQGNYNQAFCQIVQCIYYFKFANNLPLTSVNYCPILGTPYYLTYTFKSLCVCTLSRHDLWESQTPFCFRTFSCYNYKWIRKDSNPELTLNPFLVRWLLMLFLWCPSVISYTFLPILRGIFGELTRKWLIQRAWDYRPIAIPTTTTITDPTPLFN